MKRQLCVITMSCLLALSGCAPSSGSVEKTKDEKKVNATVNPVGIAGSGAMSSLTAENPYFTAAMLVPDEQRYSFKVTSMNVSTKIIRDAGGAVYQLGNYITIVLPSDSLFYPDTSDFREGSSALMQNAAQVIKEFPDNDILVTAHTDGVGSEFRQAKLSYAQAKVATLKLWSLGAVPNEQFTRYNYAGMGDQRPIANKKSGRGMLINRRIEITLYPGNAKARMSKTLRDNGVKVFQLQYGGF